MLQFSTMNLDLLRRTIATRRSDILSLEDELHDLRRKFEEALRAADSRTADQLFEQIEGACEDYLDAIREFRQSVDQLPAAGRPDFASIK